MRWGVNISLLMVASGMLGLLQGVIALDYSFAHMDEPPVDASDLRFDAYVIAVNAGCVLAAACNGIGFFRLWRGKPVSLLLHLSNGLFFLLYLPVLLYVLASFRWMPSTDMAVLAMLAVSLPLAGVTGVYAALLRRRRALAV
jgi:hypothetical protein